MRIRTERRLLALWKLQSSSARDAGRVSGNRRSGREERRKKTREAGTGLGGEGRRSWSPSVGRTPHGQRLSSLRRPLPWGRGRGERSERPPARARAASAESASLRLGRERTCAPGFFAAPAGKEQGLPAAARRLCHDGQLPRARGRLGALLAPGDDAQPRSQAPAPLARARAAAAGRGSPGSRTRRRSPILLCGSSLRRWRSARAPRRGSRCPASTSTL